MNKRAVGSPPLDLLDLIEHGVLLTGDDIRPGFPRPTRSDLLTVGAEFALAFLAGIPATGQPTDPAVGSMRPAEGDAVDLLRRPEVLLAQGIRHVTKLVLFPVRFLYTAETGLVGTNEAAAQHYRNASPPPPATELVAAASPGAPRPPAKGWQPPSCATR